MNILVTGSSGHLGEALVRSLRAGSHQVRGIDLLPSAFTDRAGSIADRDFVRSCMEGVQVVFHAATLHKPHIVTHSKQAFVDTNIMGTLHLLEEGVLAGVQAFVFTSTTSSFGDAMAASPGKGAVWVTEALRPIPKNIYGTTKIAAEDLCQLFHRNHQLPCLVLKTSRFFLEEDDRPELRKSYSDANLKANEFLHRRVDLSDIVDAHLLAMEKASEIGFARYIISATTPFTQQDVAELATHAPRVVQRIYTDMEGIYARLGWKMFPRIGRVYVNAKARRELGWQPKYDFRHVLDCVAAGKVYQSPLALMVGKKGYHDEEFEEGPYPVS